MFNSTVMTSNSIIISVMNLSLAKEGKYGLARKTTPKRSGVTKRTELSICRNIRLDGLLVKGNRLSKYFPKPVMIIQIMSNKRYCGKNKSICVKSDHSGIIKMRTTVTITAKASIIIYGTCFQFIINSSGFEPASLFNLIISTCFWIIPYKEAISGLPAQDIYGSR